MAGVALSAVSVAQTFTPQTGVLPGSYNSGGCVGVTDMNNDGSDDIILLDGSNHLKVLYQLPGAFVEEDYGVLSSAEQWGFTVGDLNNDGHNDVVSGGSYDGVHMVSIGGMGDSEEIGLANGSMFMQDCNMHDVDNDGYLDFFACHDHATSRIWQNDGSGMLEPSSLIDLEDYDFSDYPDTDHSGNYGAVWSDFDDDGDTDLYIAKCRQGVSDPNDPRRINQLWINNGDGTWTEDALSRGLVIYEQSWTADFADYDNDGDFDCLITNHSTNIVLLENDGTGHFTDVSEDAGIAGYEGFFLQAKMADFDNDGFNDIIWAGGTHRYLHNNGDGTFSEVVNAFDYGDTMHSFGIGDLNSDGFLDVYASYGNIYVGADFANPDILYLNETNDNNWVMFDLEGTVSNINAVGAKIKLYGDWGVQVREVRAGESYGIVNTFHVHFGIGQSEDIDMVEIEWPSGIVTEIENPDINTVHSILETECVFAGAEIDPDGPVEICPGESVTLSGTSDLLAYEWSTGETGTSIVVEESGFYSATATDGECSGITNTIAVEVVQAVLPTISVNGELEFCEGGSVELISSQAGSYSWSDDSETQAITVTESGTYQVSVEAQCAGMLSSEAVEVIVYDAPDTPVVEGVSIETPGTATIEGTGNLLQWYANETDMDPLFIGNSFETPFVETTASFWVSDVLEYGGEPDMGGRPDRDTNNGQYHPNSDFWIIFDAHEDLVIDSVKVYAGESGMRSIGVVGPNNNVIIEAEFMIEEGEHYVPLNFFVPAGENYGLRAFDNDPQLWRDGQGSNPQYPYAVGDLATITTTSINGDTQLDFYYFFYDWHVSTPLVQCESDRVEVVVTVVDVTELEGLNAWSVYPNPAANVITLNLATTESAVYTFEMHDLTGRKLEERNVNAAGGQHKEVIDINGLAPGVYQLSLTRNGKRATTKLIVK